MSLASGDLTTLAVAKAYLANPPSDVILAGLITRISAQIRGTLNRGLLIPRNYVQQFSGQGTRQLVLPEYPLLSLSSLVVSGVSVPLSAQVGSQPFDTSPFGYRFQPWSGVPPGQAAVLDLTGFNFLWGRQNVVATYSAGYQVSGEAQTVPSAAPYTITPIAPYGSWATDQGVVYAATGVALAAISSGTPMAGQYLPPAPDAISPRLTYTFAAADTGAGVLLSYGFVPADLEQAALEFVAERASYRTRVGLRSQGLAGQETIAYDLSGITRYVMDVLAEYISPLPPAMGAPL